LEQGQHVVLNFSGVTLATQSFVHALISKALRQYGEKALQMISFEGCQPLIKGIVETVVQYVLEAEEADEQRS
jgi:hypothetical protein